MSGPVLHYIYDPLCGWCHGASPLVQAARDAIAVRAHGGGMMAGAARRPVTPDLRQHVMAHDRRIALLSGQPFGQAYFDGLLRDQGAVFDSAPPIAAVLAADQLAGVGLDLLAGLQQAHYVEGRRIAEVTVIRELAMDICGRYTALPAPRRRPLRWTPSGRDTSPSDDAASKLIRLALRSTTADWGHRPRLIGAKR